MKRLLIVPVLFLAVCFTSCSKDDDPAPGPTPPTTATVNMAGMAFSPATLTVKVGTIVRFNNNDGMSHTATSTSAPPVFNSGTIAAGSSYSYTTTTVGNFPYVCGFHPAMTGTLIVTN